ncbi:unnamed protein product [Effrenium voratum]|uniref:Uncharacterized protein n=1 Tax=Effrenium voratum TaxID=2562239 RepID=A0AA36IS35_9DINO|nr:unnamed protein product [Effrenium voratum]
MAAYPSLLSTRTREKALLRATLRALNEQRAKLELPKVAFVQILAEAAQLAAAAELAALRTGALVEAAPEAAVASAEPDLEPEAEAEVEAEPEASPAPASPAAVPVSEGRRAAEVLLRCVPAFRLEPSCGTFSRVLRLAEAPAFFTMAPKEKAYEVSLQSLAETTAAEWSGQEDWPAARVVGLGCSVDMDRDDKALLFAVFA